jgi:hypothetical protein
MAVRYFALILGIIFVLVAVLGFLGVGTAPPAGGANADVHAHAQHLYLLGLFPVNLWHNLIHLAFGIWGIVAYRRFDAARVYSRAVAIIYAVLAIFGLIPNLNTVFGLIPIHGNDVWLHALIAVAAAYFGFAPATERATSSRADVTEPPIT